MKQTLYVQFEVEADCYQDAESKLKDSFQSVDTMLADTILLNNKEKSIREVIGTHKLVNHAKI